MNARRPRVPVMPPPCETESYKAGSDLERMVFSWSGPARRDNLRHRARVDLQKPRNIGERVAFAHRDHHRRIAGGAARRALKDRGQRTTTRRPRNLRTGALTVRPESRDELVIAQNRVSREPHVVALHAPDELAKP